MELSYSNYKYADEVKSKTFSITGKPLKNLLLHFVVVLMITLFISIIISAYLNAAILPLSRQLLLMTIFFILSSCHIFLYPKWFQYVAELPFKVVMIYSFLFTLVIWGTTYLSFFMSGLFKPQLALIAACSFLLPIIIGIAWTCFIAIDPITYIEPWFVPVKNNTTQSNLEITNGFQIKFRLKLYYFDDDEEEFDITIVGSLRLGKIFHDLLVEHAAAEIKIQQLNYQLKPYGWIFYVKEFAGVKRLDPALTFYDNGIKQDDIIYVERINIQLN